MSIASDETLRFLAALGTRLGSNDADDHPVDPPTKPDAIDGALKRLWQIAPLPRVGRRGAPTPFRGYDEEQGRSVLHIVALLIDSLASVYRHESIRRFLAEHPVYARRSRGNLRAMVHPQNILRPFDPLHAIGRTLRPLFVLRPHFDRHVARDGLRFDFALTLPDEAVGGWSKAWFVGLLATTYLCWRWHDDIPVSREHPGWYSLRPLARLEDDPQQALLNRRLPGGAVPGHLVSEDSSLLTFTDFGDDWTRWHSRDIGAYGAADAASPPKVRKRARGRLPNVPSAPLFETYCDWVVAVLGLYSGAHDPRLEGDELASCLLLAEPALDEKSNLHAFVRALADQTSPLFGHAAELFGVIPSSPDFDERENRDWGRMMTALLQEHCRDFAPKHRADADGDRDAGERRVACYPIESYTNQQVAPTVGDLARELSRAMPHFRDLTSRAWMFFVDEPSASRLSHPDPRERSTHRHRNPS